MAYDWTARYGAFKEDVNHRVSGVRGDVDQTAADLAHAGVILHRIQQTAEAFDISLLGNAHSAAGRASYYRLLASAPFEVAISLANDGFAELLGDGIGDIGHDLSIEIADLQVTASQKYFGLTAANATAIVTRGEEDIFRFQVALDYSVTVRAGTMELKGQPVGEITVRTSDGPQDLADTIRAELYNRHDQLSWTRPLPAFGLGEMALPRQNYLTYADSSLHILGGSRDGGIATPRLVQVPASPRNRIGMRFDLGLLVPVVASYGRAMGADLRSIAGAEAGRRLYLEFKAVQCKSKRFSEIKAKGCGYAVAKTSVDLSHTRTSIRIASSGEVDLDVGLESLEARIAGVKVSVPGELLDILEGLATRLGVNLRRRLRVEPFVRAINCTGFIVTSVGTWRSALYFIIERSLSSSSEARCLPPQ